MNPAAAFDRDVNVTRAMDEQRLADWAGTDAEGQLG